MLTNFQMVSELDKNFKPEKFGVLTNDEVNLISESLCLSQMSVLELRNLRDFVVLYFTFFGQEQSPSNVVDRMDRMSGITSVIDDALVKKGVMP